ncbi:GntR family transcriptional regulator [Janibacter sp. CX7]|uniref:GntR family transcriptional regulator n=1 Tax=Janibacter sp. CX7 TaxID=2963431 RepID=UPI0020CD07B7|nr:GntR family transcriptional regulator [Janibacter sp. CX7]UTT65660.1 GntR family transcriptional regulator [Janibacter sp. CX7]
MTTSPSTETKAGRLHAALRDEILSGQLAAGSPVDEVAVAQAHGVSRTPVREALRALRSEGLLVPGARRQLHVVDVSPEHRQEIATVRAALETAAARVAASTRSSGDVDSLRLMVLRQRRYARAGDSGAFMEADEDFHRALAQVAAMPTLDRLLDQLGSFVRLARLGEPTPRTHMMALTREHHRLLDLLEEGDGDALAETLSGHILSTASRR